MTHKTAHPQKLALFLALSLADLVLTLLLIHQGDGRVYEGNPVAGWWLGVFGGLGLFLFKVLAVLAVISLSLGISRYRPQMGGAVLVFACATVGLVLLYSSGLAFTLAPKDSVKDASIQAESSRLDQRLHGIHDYQQNLGRLCKGLLGRQLPLRQAVLELARTKRGQDPRWLKLLRDHYQVDSDEQALGANLVAHVLVSQCDSPELDNHRNWLNGEYRAAFGVPTPSWALWPLAGPNNAEKDGPSPLPVQEPED